MGSREILTWDRYGQAATALATVIADDGYQPDLILAIARGGMIIAGSLAYALAIKNLYVMNVVYYTGVNERMEFPVILPPPLNLIDMAQARILIADDVADTGHTLALVRDFCGPQVAEVRCAVLYQKPASVVECEYVWRRTDEWIDFPWSTDASIVVRQARDDIA
jgi:hypoxanthine phosphoribosyltransferase